MIQTCFIFVQIQTTRVMFFLSYLDDLYISVLKCSESVGDHPNHCNLFSYTRGAEDVCEMEMSSSEILNA